MKPRNEHQPEREQAQRRFWLSLLIIGTSLIILAIASFKNYKTGSPLEPDTIFTAIVGLVGSWVGTILAFYYTKDNFEAASRSNQELVRQITGKSLDVIPAKDVMIGINRMSYLRIEEGKSEIDYPLKDLLEKYYVKFNRLPVLASDNSPKYAIHRSIMDKFLASQLFKEGETPDLTLQSLLGDPDIEKMIKAFITAGENDSLTTIKNKMNAVVIEQSNNDKVYVADVFITESGSAKSPVIGWITNVDISKLSKI